LRRTSPDVSEGRTAALARGPDILADAPQDARRINDHEIADSPSIHLNEEPAIIVRKAGSAVDGGIKKASNRSLTMA
jgi:hypothetical protein